MTRIGVTTVTGKPPTITFPLLLAGSVGALLIYCAIVNKTPAAVLKEAIGQQAAATVSTARSGNIPKNTPTGAGTSGTGGKNIRI